MEKRSQVNRYSCTHCGRFIFTINLNNGTTPFTIECICEEQKTSMPLMQSNFYKFKHIGLMNIQFCFYRPTPADYAKLNYAYRDFIYGGALINAPLEEAKPFYPDFVDDRQCYQDWLEYFTKYYGEKPAPTPEEKKEIELIQKKKSCGIKQV